MSFTFVLVHGHWHGAWAWSRLAPLLRQQGHRVLTPQLPSNRLGCGAAANAHAVTTEIDADDLTRSRRETAPSDLVLVGHSAGGLTIPLVAEQRSTIHMIFLAAVLPIPGVSLAEQLKADADSGVAGFTWTERRDGLLEMPPEIARRHFFHDCPDGEADEALRLLRLQTPTTIDEPSPVERWPDIPTDYIVCLRDRVLNPSWQRRLAIERLGVVPIEIDSGHSPALSRPAELARTLVELAERRA